MIKCSVIRDLLPLYIDGVASSDTREMVEEHLETCPSCRRELEQLQKPLSLPLENDSDGFRKLLSQWKKKSLKLVIETIFITLACCSFILLLSLMKIPASHGSAALLEKTIMLRGGPCFMLDVHSRMPFFDAVFIEDPDGGDFNQISYRVIYQTKLASFLWKRGSQSVGVPMRWLEDPQAVSIQVVRFADETVTYKNGELVP